MTVFERMTSSSGVPRNASSSGMVIKSSISPVDMPDAFGLNFHQRRRELGKHVDGHVAECARTEQHHQRGGGR